MKSFNQYDKENPVVYEEFKKYADQLINRGYRHLSSKLICEIIRFNSMIETKGKYKINNNYTADYARKFEKDFPQYLGYFSKRLCKFED